MLVILEVKSWAELQESAEKKSCWLIRPSYLLTSVTRCRECFFNIWPFTTLQICPKAHWIFQSRFKSLPSTNWSLKKLPNTFKNIQSGDISPNLVTLLLTYIVLPFYATFIYLHQIELSASSFDDDVPPYASSSAMWPDNNCQMSIKVAQKWFH